MIIYLHGFNSTGDSEKGQYIKEVFTDTEVLTPTYHYDPRIAIKQLRELVEKSISQSDWLLLTGASLGGYYAQYLAYRYRTLLCMINPALLPLAVLEDYLGENTNYYSGETYTVTRQYLEYLTRLDVPEPCNSPVPTLLLLDEGDELIDYQQAMQRYQDCAEIICYQGGDHQFAHLPESIDKITAFIKRNI